MKYFFLMFIVLFLYSCKKSKPQPNSPTPSNILSNYKSLDSNYVRTMCVYSKFTSDNNILAVFKKLNNDCELVKITPDGNISWSTTLGSELFDKSIILELNNDMYLVSSREKTYVINHVGTLIKNYPMMIMDGTINGSFIYLVNLDYCYKVDMNYNLVDSFLNQHKPSGINGSSYYGDNVASGFNGILLTRSCALFKGNNKIQYFYQDSISSFNPSPLNIIDCNLDNSFIDSFHTSISFTGFQTFKTSDNHIIFTAGLWGTFGPSFFLHLYTYDNGSTMQDVFNNDYSLYLYDAPMCEQADNEILFTSFGNGTQTFYLNYINASQNNVSNNTVISDSIVTKDIIYSTGNIAGLISQPGTENVYLITIGQPINQTPQILKINGTPELINF